MSRNVPRMVGMAALLLLLSGTATATSYPSADQYSLRNHYRITRRSAGHEIPPSVSAEIDEDEEERQRQAVSLTELLQLWEPQHREEERRPQRGDIEVTTKGIERGDVPLIGKRKKFVKRQAPEEMWGFAEDDGLLMSDEEPRPATSHPHRKHHHNSGLIETDETEGQVRWRGPEEEMRRRPGLKDRRPYNNDRQRYDEEQRQRLYEMRRAPDERRDNPRQQPEERRDSPRQQPDASNETRRRQEEEQRQRQAAYELRRRQEEQQRREHSRPEEQRREHPRPEEQQRREHSRQNENNERRRTPDNREDEARRRQEEEEQRRRAYETRRREENSRQSENERRKQPNARDDEARRRQEEEDQRQKAYDARHREQEADAGDTYEKRMQEWRKMKEEHDRLVREREQQWRQQHQPDPQRPEAHTRSKSQEELENERKLQEYIRRNTPIAVPPSGNRDPASDRIRENEQVRRAEHERRLEEERRRKQVQEESRRLAEEERMRRIHEGEAASNNKTKHRGTSSVRPRWPINTIRTPVETSRRGQPQNRPEDYDERYLESRRNEAANSSRRPSSEATEAKKEEEEEERLKRLKGLPVSATIIVRSTDTDANRTSTSPPPLNLRFGENIDFPGFSPGRRGPEATRFPAPVTKRPPVPSPQPCVWAIVVCCQQHRQPEPNQAMRITRCFEATNCPGASWDTERRCSEDNVRAANDEIRMFYLKGQDRNY